MTGSVDLTKVPASFNGGRERIEPTTPKRKRDSARKRRATHAARLTIAASL
jgi:hypothetical protein